MCYNQDDLMRFCCCPFPSPNNMLLRAFYFDWRWVKWKADVSVYIIIMKTNSIDYYLYLERKRVLGFLFNHSFLSVSIFPFWGKNDRISFKTFDQFDSLLICHGVITNVLQLIFFFHNLYKLCINAVESLQSTANSVTEIQHSSIVWFLFNFCFR